MIKDIKWSSWHSIISSSNSKLDRITITTVARLHHYSFSPLLIIILHDTLDKYPFENPKYNNHRLVSLDSLTNRGKYNQSFYDAIILYNPFHQPEVTDTITNCYLHRWKSASIDRLEIFMQFLRILNTGPYLFEAFQRGCNEDGLEAFVRLSTHWPVVTKTGGWIYSRIKSLVPLPFTSRGEQHRDRTPRNSSPRSTVSCSI